MIGLVSPWVKCVPEARPAVTFADGLRETVAWYLANAEWVARVRSGEYQKYYERQYGNR